MRQKILWMGLIVLAVMIAGPAIAQEVIIYPAKGQSEDQATDGLEQRARHYPGIGGWTHEIG